MTVPNQGTQAKDDPSNESSDRSAVREWLELITDILEGAASVRRRYAKYLPKYHKEDDQEYKRRVKSAPWRPEFVDTLRTLSSKPFEEDVSLQGDGVPEVVRGFSEDVDGQGNNLTQFSKNYFRSAVANGVSFLVVDFPSIPEGATRKDEAEVGARPYWIHVELKDVVALYSDYRGGREVFTHFRYREVVKRRDGFSEVTVERIRVYDEGSWEVFERDNSTKKWVTATEEDGTLLKGSYRRGTTGSVNVPVVPLFLGEREGELKTRPSLLDLADMQIELYRALSRKDEILTFAGSPILTGNGLSAPKPPAGPIVVGPRSVLYAPGSGDRPGSWQYISPDAANIQQIRDDAKSIVDDMRRLGMQPLTQGSGTPTATGQSLEASKSHSAVKAWALKLKDALEQGYVYTTEYLNEPNKVEVSVFTDFDVLPFAQAPLDTLSKARDKKDISQRTFWEGLRRFDVLSQEFNADEEEKRLALEGDDPSNEVDVDPRTGKPLGEPQDVVK